jgi:hypothetical protein
MVGINRSRPAPSSTQPSLADGLYEVLQGKTPEESIYEGALEIHQLIRYENNAWERRVAVIPVGCTTS